MLQQDYNAVNSTGEHMSPVHNMYTLASRYDFCKNAPKVLKQIILFFVFLIIKVVSIPSELN